MNNSAMILPPTAAALPRAGVAPQLAALVPFTLAGAWRARWASFTIIGCVMLVAVILNAFLTMTRGFAEMANSAGSEQVVVWLGQGADSEAGSVLTPEQVALLASAPGLAQLTAGSSLSPELTMTVSRRARDGAHRINASLRGVGSEGVALRQGLSIVDGRMFTPGRYELIVGRALYERVSEVRVGGRIMLSGRVWEVVGVYTLPSAVFETEYMTDLLSLQSAYGRESQIQTVRARLADTGALSALQAFVAAEPRLNVTTVTERQFYREQVQDTTNVVSYLGWPLVLILSIGALAGMFNTMLIVLEGRRHSLSVLRMLGFSPAAVRLSVLLETVLLSVLGALIGTALVYLAAQGREATLVGSGFTTIPFRLGLDAVALLQSLGLAVVLGLIGGLASSVRVVAAMKTATARWL